MTRFRLGIILGILFLFMASVSWAAPTVTAVQPPDPVSTSVSVSFSEGMDSASITTGSFNLYRSFQVIAVAAGESHTVALKGDGTVVAWGTNNWGEATIPEGLSNVMAIAAGYTYTVALKNDGSVVVWGVNCCGQGDVPAAALSGVIAIAAGGRHIVALKENGTVIAWGDNTFGQSTIPENLSGVVAVAAGTNHTVALKGDGTVVAWGLGANGTQSGQATVPEGLSDVIGIAAGSSHTAALKRDGSVVAWGWGQFPIPEAALSNVTAIAAGNEHTLALKADGTVVAWGGSNSKGQNAVPEGLSNVMAIAGGGVHSVALKNDGKIVIWGGRDYDYGFDYVQTRIPTGLSGVVAVSAGAGQSLALQADGALTLFGGTSLPIPASISGLFKAIASGGNDFNAAVKTNGTVVAWGDNSSGQANIPPGLSGVKAVAVGTAHVLALTDNNEVVGWGDNSYGQAMIPAGVLGVISISAGSFHSVALRNDGSVVAWGDNGWGQCNVPAEALSGVIAIAAGQHHTVALKENGSVIAWGYNDLGQISVPPAALADVVAIAAGYNHTVAVKRDGTVIAWGRNDFGQTNVPTGLSGVTTVAAGGLHTIALKRDGTVVAWGDNRLGQSGIYSPLSPFEAAVDGVVSYDSGTNTATFLPSAPLQNGITYMGTVNTGARSATGGHITNDIRWSFSTEGINPSLTLVGLKQTYDGAPKAVTVMTVPIGLNTDITYNGSAVPPTDPGTYEVVATINDPNYQGSVSGILEITKVPATITLSNLNQTYDGTTKGVTVSTNPTGLAFDVNYNGSPTVTDAGTYNVIANINDTYYQGSATGTLTIAKATATVTLSELNQTYNGTPRVVTATTLPAGLFLEITYNGSATAPTSIGAYEVVATINQLNYQGSASGTLVIAKGDQTISFSCPTTARKQDIVTLSASASSGLPVSFTVSSGPGVLDASNNLTFTAKGTVVVTASQAGDNNYNAAAVQGTILVE